MSDDDARHSEPAGLSPDVGVDGPTLARYVAGECSPSEVARITAWLATSPSGRELVSALKAVWRSTEEATHPPGSDSVAAWEQLRPMLDTSERGAAARVRGRLRIEAPASRARPWRSIALGMAATVVAVVVWRTTSHGTPGPRALEFATPAGGRATVTLRDGTQLTLGPATRLHVPANFGKGIRTVDLDGEAVFAVVHDAAHPFLVRTSRTQVRDVGTVFAVRAYRVDTDDQVAVQEGAVAVDTAVLRPHDVARVTTGGGVAVRRGADLAPYFAWTQGRLVFDATPLRDVVREVGRAFDLEITLDDSTLGAERVTASFADQPADAILEDIAAIVGGRYERTGHAAVIRRRPRGAPPSRHDTVLPLRSALAHE